MEQNSSKARGLIKTISKTASELSEASRFLTLTINWLVQEEVRADLIKPDMGYIESISKALRERAEGVFDNVRERSALNQYDEDQFSERLSYECYSKAHADHEHIKKVLAAVKKAEADGEDMTEWMLKNTNIEDVITGKVQRPWKPEPSSIGKILKEWRGDRYSLYAIAKECGCRSEGLQRIEEGKDVTTTNLMHYLHFIKAHDPQSDVIAAIWQAL